MRVSLAAGKVRTKVLALLILLSVITYLDRVCISVAGPRMQQALGIRPAAWGWVTGVFVLSYAIFEIPTGVLGDRIGARRVLTRIVLWWSAFTTLTGLLTGYYPLLVTRFLFGAGEAGAYPNASVVISRWFPIHERGRAFGMLIMAGQIGGAAAPLLVVPIQMRFGWRACFFVFGLLGVFWSIVWYAWYRDTPAEKRGVAATETTATRGLTEPIYRPLPWTQAMRSANLWAVLGVALCYMYTYFFFQSWFHTYLVRARGFSEENLLLSSLPYAVAASSSLSGGLLSNFLAKKIGLRWGRCAIGVVSLGIAAICTFAVTFTPAQFGSLALLTAVYAGISFQQPIMFAVCLDIGGAHAGAVVGAMNTSAQVGAFASSLTFGFLAERFASYDAPFVPMAFMLLLGAVLWAKVDPAKPLFAMPTVGSADAVPAGIA